MQLQVAALLHRVGVCGSLGVDVEHNKAVKAVAQGNPFHRFEGVIQIVRLGGGGVDADANQRVFPPCAQNIPIFGIEIRGILISPFFFSDKMITCLRDDTKEFVFRLVL